MAVTHPLLDDVLELFVVVDPFHDQLPARWGCLGIFRESTLPDFFC